MIELIGPPKAYTPRFLKWGYKPFLIERSDGELAYPISKCSPHCCLSDRNLKFFVYKTKYSDVILIN